LHYWDGQDRVFDDDFSVVPFYNSRPHFAGRNQRTRGALERLESDVRAIGQEIRGDRAFRSFVRAAESPIQLRSVLLPAQEYAFTFAQRRPQNNVDNGLAQSLFDIARAEN
jgi:hypothetical protein